MIKGDEEPLFSTRIDDFAIALGFDVVGEDQRHVGVILRIERDLHGPSMPAILQDGLYLLHLFWHWDVRGDDWRALSLKSQQKYIILANSLISPPVRKVFASACRELIYALHRETPPQIPYGFDQPTTASPLFESSTMRWLPGKDNIGLTCATFIMSLFDMIAYPLLDLSTWQHRPEDAAWQTQILEQLQKRRRRDVNKHRDTFSEVYIQKQTSYIGNAARFRPEEVAFAATRATSHPAPFDRVAARSLELLQQAHALLNADTQQDPQQAESEAKFLYKRSGWVEG